MHIVLFLRKIRISLIARPNLFLSELCVLVCLNYKSEIGLFENKGKFYLQMGVV